MKSQYSQHSGCLVPGLWFLSIANPPAKFEPGIWPAPHLLPVYLYNFGLDQSKTEEEHIRKASARQKNYLADAEKKEKVF